MEKSDVEERKVMFCSRCHKLYYIWPNIELPDLKINKFICSNCTRNLSDA